MLCANSLLSCLVRAGWCVQGIFAVPLQPCNWGFKLQQRFLSSPAQPSREQSAAPGPENEDRSMAAVRHLSLHRLHHPLQCTTAQSRRGQIYNQTLHYLKEGGMKNYWQFNTMNVFSTFYSMFKTLCNFCKILYWSVLEWFFKAENSIYTKSTYNIWIKVTGQLEWKIQSTFL